jgi:hypothetical protein
MNELHVPRDYPTIQAAVNDAAPGDLVRVGVGEFFENVVIINESDVRITGTTTVI